MRTIKVLNNWNFDLGAAWFVREDTHEEIFLYVQAIGVKYSEIVGGGQVLTFNKNYFIAKTSKGEVVNCKLV
jgi:hypothetical protein